MSEHCPHCGKEVLREANFCRACGQPLRQVPKLVPTREFDVEAETERATAKEASAGAPHAVTKPIPTDIISERMIPRPEEQIPPTTALFDWRSKNKKIIIIASLAFLLLVAAIVTLTAVLRWRDQNITTARNASQSYGEQDQSTAEKMEENKIAAPATAQPPPLPDKAEQEQQPQRMQQPDAARAAEPAAQKRQPPQPAKAEEPPEPPPATQPQRAIPSLSIVVIHEHGFLRKFCSGILRLDRNGISFQAADGRHKFSASERAAAKQSGIKLKVVSGGDEFNFRFASREDAERFAEKLKQLTGR